MFVKNKIDYKSFDVTCYCIDKIFKISRCLEGFVTFLSRKRTIIVSGTVMVVVK